jgi:hypothetical protein
MHALFQIQVVGGVLDQRRDIEAWEAERFTGFRTLHHALHAFCPYWTGGLLVKLIVSHTAREVL